MQGFTFARRILDPKKAHPSLVEITGVEFYDIELAQNDVTLSSKGSIRTANRASATAANINT